MHYKKKKKKKLDDESEKCIFIDYKLYNLQIKKVIVKHDVILHEQA